MRCAIAIAALVASTGVQAQSMERMAQATINASGKACAAVTSVRPLGTIDDGTPLVAAYCSDGKGHVLKITPRDTFEYLTSCSAFNAVSTRSRC
jgi:hypothetical protein